MMNEIHNPANLELPPLKIAKSSDSLSFEANREVKAFVASNLLLERSFNAVYMQLLAKTKEHRQLIELAEAEYEPWPRIVELPSHGPQLRDFLPIAANTVTITYANHSVDTTVFMKQYEELLAKQAATARQAVGQKIIQLSNEVQNILSQYGQTIGKQIPILSTETLYVCLDCNRIVSVDWLQATACKCGKAISSTSDVSQVSVKCLNKTFTQFLEANRWLENGIAHLFRQKNAQVLVGQHVLGHSGVWHEIDVIAESKQHNHRVLCECKNAELKVSQVFVLSGKMADVGCTRGYIFTTAVAVSQDIFRLSRSKNIVIVHDVLNRTRNTLLDELKDF